MHSGTSTSGWHLELTCCGWMLYATACHYWASIFEQKPTRAVAKRTRVIRTAMNWIVRDFTCPQKVISANPPTVCKGRYCLVHQKGSNLTLNIFRFSSCPGANSIVYYFTELKHWATSFFPSRMRQQSAWTPRAHLWSLLVRQEVPVKCLRRRTPVLTWP